MVDFLYDRLHRRGYLRRDCERMVNLDRNIFGSLLLQLGEGDAMITGITRTFARTMREVRRVIDPAPGRTALGNLILVGQRHPVFIADNTINERHSANNTAERRDGTGRVRTCRSRGCPA